MADHDPLCPFSVYQQNGCKCYWIELGRADERERNREADARRDALAGLRAIADRWESDPDRYDIEIAAVRDAVALIEEEK